MQPSWRQLWLGWPRWPVSHRVEPNRKTLGLWDEIHMTYRQVGDVVLKDLLGFGLVFELPELDPLALWLNGLEVESTGLALVPEIDEVVRVRRELSDLGLGLDPLRYFHLCTGYTPLDGASAWRYALSRNLLLVIDRGHEETALESPADRGLTSFADVAGLIERAWRRVPLAAVRPDEEP